MFVSDSPLDWPDPDTRQRAMILELLNLELSTIEPWAAAANVLTTADSNVPAVSGAVLQAEHARLLLPIWCSPRAQYRRRSRRATRSRWSVPGVPEPSNAYQLTASGIQSVPRRRVAGGVSVMLAEFGLTAQVVLAEEPTIIGAIQQRKAQPGRRAAVLERELAVEKFNRVRRLAGQLAPHTPVSDRPKWFDAAMRHLVRQRAANLAQVRRPARRRQSARRRGRRPADGPFAAARGAGVLGHRRPRACLAGHQPGCRELCHVALALAADGPAGQGPSWPEPAARRKL